MKDRDIQMKIKKRFFFSIVEEMIMNRDYDGYAAGRIEVYDNKIGGGYHHYEGRFFIPLELLDDFRKLIDFVESDKPIYINLPMKIPRNKDLKKTEDVWQK